MERKMEREMGGGFIEWCFGNFRDDTIQFPNTYSRLVIRD